MIHKHIFLHNVGTMLNSFIKNMKGTLGMVHQVGPAEQPTAANNNLGITPMVFNWWFGIHTWVRT